MKSDCSAQEYLLAPTSSRANLSITEATMLLTNIAMGILLVIAPLSLYSVGWVLGISFLVLGSLLQIQTASVLVRIISQNGAYSYEDIASSLLGRKWLIFVNFILIVGQGSVSIGVIYVSASSLRGFLFSLFESPPYFLTNKFCIFLIAVLIFPFVLKREIKGIRAAAFIMLSLIFLFIITLLIYYFQNYHKLRELYPHSKFNVPFLPERPAFQIIPKITVLLSACTFNQASAPVLSSIKHFSIRRATISIVAGTACGALVFLTISIFGATLFGELITHQDSLIKVLFLYNDSYISLVSQLLFTFITIYHCPVYIFSARESSLLFFNILFKCARKEECLEQSPFPKMYNRVPRWLFYSVSLADFLIIVIITLFISNLIAYIQILGLPILVFLNSLFPNIAILAANGPAREPLALVCLLVGILAGLLPFLFGLIAVLN